MSQFVFLARDERATERFGAALAAALPESATLALIGTLGAGKTRLVQAIATALGVPRDDVISPTFVLCQTYEGQRVIHHLDAYRVQNADEFRELGVEELFSSAIIVVEWADRILGTLPSDIVTVEIQVTGETERTISVSGHSEQAVAIVRELERRLGTAR